MGANMAEKWLQMIRWHQSLLTSASQNSDLHREELLDSVTHLSSNEAHLHGQNSGLAFSAASGGRNISLEHITTIVWYNRSPSTETRAPTYGCYDSTPFHWNLKQKAFWFSRECPSADPSTRILFRDIKRQSFCCCGCCVYSYFKAVRGGVTFQVSYCCMATVRWPTCCPRLLKIHLGCQQANSLLHLAEWDEDLVTHERKLWKRHCCLSLTNWHKSDYPGYNFTFIDHTLTNMILLQHK